MTRFVTGVAALAVVSLMASQARAQSQKIGFVDLQRALLETEEGRRIKSQLEKEMQTKQKEVNERRDKFQAKVEDLKKKRSLLPEDTRLKIETELQEEGMKLQETFMRLQQDLQQKEGEATKKIFERMQVIIMEIAKTEDMTFVFDRAQAGMIFAEPAFDLTNQLIRRYNAGAAKAPAAGGKPAPGKPAAPAK
jgi:outer membrane protein